MNLSSLQKPVYKILCTTHDITLYKEFKDSTTWLLLLLESSALLASEGPGKSSRLAPSRDPPVTARLPGGGARVSLGSNSKALERRGQKCGERGGGGDDDEGSSADFFLAGLHNFQFRGYRIF